MKQRKPFWRVLFFCFALVLAVPVVSLLQNPMEAEAAAPKLSKKKATVKEGKTITLTVKNPTQKVTWKSSNSKVVKITKKTGSNKSKATLKGLKKGTATITAKIGKKKLTAKITVKHVHKWRGYATCTEPDTCKTCGAGRGSALGHSWSPATCLSPAVCQRCGITQGGPGAHVWDQNEICTVCNTLNISRILNMRITNVGNFTDNAKVRIENRGNQQYMLSSAGSSFPVPATLTTGGKIYKTYLWNNSLSSFVSSAMGSADTTLWFAIESYNPDDFFTVTFDSSIVFDISYFNQNLHRFETYKATVTPSGCSFTKY